MRAPGVGGVGGLACSQLRAGKAGTLCPAFIGLKRGPCLRKGRRLVVLGFGTEQTMGFGLGTRSKVLMSGGVGIVGISFWGEGYPF